MGVSRTEQIMLGAYVKELPFDPWEDKYEPYICGADNASFWIASLSEYENKGYIIGKVLVFGDPSIGIKLQIIDTDVSPLRDKLIKEVKEQIDMDLSEDDIKLYAFTSWS